MDYELMSNEYEVFTFFTDIQKRRAQLQVCRWANDVEQATDLLMMLGLHPGQNDDAEYVTAVPTLPNSSNKG